MRRVLLLCCLLLAWSGGALAHDYANSRLRATTQGADLDVSFLLNAESIVDLISLRKEELPKTEKARIPEFRDLVLGYLDEHFTVKRGAKQCRRQAPARFSYMLNTDRVLVDTRYKCANEDNVIELRSELFLTEDTPHQVLATFVHKHAMERYFFTGGERVATIKLDTLRQRDKPKRVDPGGVRVARPPDGAFGGASRQPSVEKKNDALPVAPENDAKSADEPKGDDEVGRAEAMGSGFRRFFKDGFAHIFSGIDHILFVLSLLLVTRRWKDLAIVVTGFTVAHSITLALGAFDLVTISSRIVEPVIAASIVYVALENVVSKKPRARLAVTFVFGLVHGFGFSESLRALGLSGRELVPALLGFNLGVEAGQLVIVLPLFLVLLWLQKKERLSRSMLVAASSVVAVIGAWWFAERLLG